MTDASAESLHRRLAKLERINDALMQRLIRIGEARGPAWVQTRTAAMLERELVTRNRDLELALQNLASINAELEKATDVADEANRAKTRFLRAASHDLLQPLSAARLFLSHLQDTTVEPRQQDLVGTISATLESAEELIQALSNIAKLDSRQFRMHRAPVSIERLFRRLRIDTRPLAMDRGIDLRFVHSTVTVDSDPVYLRQIAQNLIANALKYTDGRKVLVGMHHQGGNVWLQVHDQGPGIAPADQERIFVEFERLSPAGSPGTGLGLSIVRRACEQLGHRLELDSRPGRGSCFRVLLPCRAAPVSDPRRAPVRVPAMPDFGGRRVLVVENDRAVRQAFTMLLGGWHFDVEACADLRGALEATARGLPDLVISDYRLDDGETGVSLLEALQRVHGMRLPGVIVTAEDILAVGREAGEMALAVLRKPVSDTDLREAIELALATGVQRFSGA